MKKFLVGAVLLLMLALCSFGQIPSQGLVMWCCFTGNIVDSCGNITFTPQPGYSPSFQPDRFSTANSSLSFNNGRALVAQSCTALPSGSSDRTISMWVSRLQSTTNTFETFLYYGKNTNGNYLNFGVCFGGNYVYVKNGTDSLKITARTYEDNMAPCFPANTWKHISLVTKNDTAIFYQNGKEWGRKVIASWATLTDSMIIGGMNSGFASQFLNAFQGNMDDVSIYNKALTSSQINRLFVSGSYRNTPPKFTSKPDTILIIGNQYRYNPTTADTSTISLSVGPIGMTLTNKTILWSPTQTGTNNVALIATDNIGDTTYQRFKIVVDAGTYCRNIFQHSSIEGYSNQKAYNIAGKVILNSERMKYRKIGSVNLYR